MNADTPVARREEKRIAREAQRLHVSIERLCAARVLNPACGSGDFLYNGSQ